MGDDARRTIGMSRAGIAAGLLLALTATGVAAAPGSTARAGIMTPTVATAVFDGAKASGIVVIQDDGASPHPLWISLAGLPKAGTLRVIASSKVCSKTHSPADRVLGYSFGATQAGSFAVTVARPLAGPFELIRSVRIFRAGGTQRACAKGTLHDEQHASAAAPAGGHGNTSFSSLIPSPGFKGLLLARKVDGDTVRVVLSALRVDGDFLFRVVGSTEPCGGPHSSSDRVFQVPLDAIGGEGQRIDYFIRTDFPAPNDPDLLRSVRVFRGSGSGAQVECRGIIAVLIG
jgi:hypothetical protein